MTKSRRLIRSFRTSAARSSVSSRSIKSWKGESPLHRAGTVCGKRTRQLWRAEKHIWAGNTYGTKPPGWLGRLHRPEELAEGSRRVGKTAGSRTGWCPLWSDEGYILVLNWCANRAVAQPG